MNLGFEHAVAWQVAMPGHRGAQFGRKEPVRSLTAVPTAVSIASSSSIKESPCQKSEVGCPY